MNNFIVIILDGVGVGELPDAINYQDEGSNTLSNLATAVGGILLPNLESLGLGNIIPIMGINPQINPRASFGKLAEKSKGKDSTTGHWELGGIITEKEFPVYPNGFPADVINKFLSETKMKGYLANYASSGTKIILQLGDDHIRTGFPIIYTSADSVFQIAAHEDVISLERLYEICMITRKKVMVGDHEVGRIIARPFIGSTGNYSRTTNRKDFSVDPPSKTILNFLKDEGIETIAIGKINDLFNYNGITTQIKSKSNIEGIQAIIKAAQEKSNSLIIANLVDFDVYYGHRNDPVGFANALKEFDDNLPNILACLKESDRLILTADHGNDPTTPSTDHSREYVPLLFYKVSSGGKNIGVRSSFADVAQTIAHFFKVNNNLRGISFLND
ncbi:MAG: phosphopentomutase [Ignavibacteria bacterium]|nr:phosphopentomutase [Ignavibacteria bacterium]